MYVYPKCPNKTCQETNLEIVDSELNGLSFKAIICPHCQEVLYMYPNLDSKLKELQELQEKIEDLESKVSDLEDSLP